MPASLQSPTPASHGPLFLPPTALASNGASPGTPSDDALHAEFLRRTESAGRNAADTTSVQRIETKRSQPKPVRTEPVISELYEYDTPNELQEKLTPIEEAWRHGHWSARRARVDAAMVTACVSGSRLTNFRQCGARARILACPDTKELRWVGTCCHDRFCQPCQQARATRITQALHRRVITSKTLMVVLTLKSSEAPLRDQVSRLYKSAAKLRATKWWKKTVTGGCAAFEVTRNTDTGHWHPHLHLLVHAQWIDQEALCDHWQRITGDSRICHVSLVRNETAAIREATKYLAKPIHRSIDFHPASIVELIGALKGRHLILTFGTWRSDPLLQDDNPNDGKIWHFVATLNHLVARAAAGDAWARQAMSHLASKVPGRVPFPTPQGFPSG